MVALVALLLLLGTTLKLTHIHLDRCAHQDCALCQSAHNVVQPTVAPPVRRNTGYVRRVFIPSARRCTAQVFSSWHWNRPPPPNSLQA